jgi:adenosylcobinamide-GDP ribazoletransferase
MADPQEASKPAGGSNPAEGPNPAIDFLVALQFLTTSPSFLKRIFTPAELGRATGYYPLVGGLIGALLWLANGSLSSLFPPLLRAALVLALWILLTGALHLDGFLDSCDGLLGGYTPESRLEIMQDERIGAFAFAGGSLLLLIKYSSLAALNPSSLVLILAPALSRGCLTLAIYAFPYARSQGLGRAMKDHTTGWQLLLASLSALALAWFTAGWYGIALLPAAAGLTWLFARFCLARIPGLTGDTYGALNELIEAAVLICGAAAIQAGILA